MKVAVAGGTGVSGSYAAEAARDAGHEVVVLSRAQGVDVYTGAGLADVLTGVDVVVDSVNNTSVRGSVAEDFFTTTSRRLQDCGAAAGVSHIVTLSIVGIDRASGYGYYRAKLAQEKAVTEGPVPVTILRATQFHEFPAQLLQRAKVGPVAMVPRMRSQPVAARTVGQHLARLAVQRPGGTVELAGPEVHDMVDLARRLLAARGRSTKVVPLKLPGEVASQLRGGALLPGQGATIDGPTFDEWLNSDDARRIEL